MGWLQTKHPNYFVLTLSCPQHLMSQVGLRLTRFVLDVALIYIRSHQQKSTYFLILLHKKLKEDFL